MPFFFGFVAGILVGRNWAAIKNAMAPITTDASARFDQIYSDTARQIGTRVEELEDHMAERRRRSQLN